jgi:hypothetical protein
MFEYLTDIPQNMENYGLCKTFIIRKEIIHIKHIFTEIFIKKNIDINKYLDYLEWSLFDYIEYMTNQLRKIHHFSREYNNNINNIIKCNRDFFPFIKITKGLSTLITLDFDGVVTKKSFKDLYHLCIERNRTVICSANPTIKASWFNNRYYTVPNKIYSCKGKRKKINKLIELNKRYDYIFHVDDEQEYLEFCWVLGIHPYKYEHGKIKYFSMNSNKT